MKLVLYSTKRAIWAHASLTRQAKVTATLNEEVM